MEAVNRILRYLKMTLGKVLMFRKTDWKTIEAYADSNLAGSIVDRKSTFDCCTFVLGNLVTWRSKKQGVVARAVLRPNTGLWVWGYVRKFGSIKFWLIFIRSEKPMKLFCDNKASISIVNSSVQHDRTKHVKIHRHFIKERLDNGSICIMCTFLQGNLSPRGFWNQTLTFMLASWASLISTFQLEGDCQS